MGRRENILCSEVIVDSTWFQWDGVEGIPILLTWVALAWENSTFFARTARKQGGSGSIDSKVKKMGIGTER
jgi:hypothetical protein